MQPHDGVRHELTRAVVGDLAASLDALDRDASRRELVGGGQDVGRVGVPAEGQDGGMLQEQELVPDATRRALVDEPFLEGVRLAIVDAAEPAGVDRRGLAGAPWTGSVRVASTLAR